MAPTIDKFEETLRENEQEGWREETRSRVKAFRVWGNRQLSSFLRRYLEQESPEQKNDYLEKLFRLFGATLQVYPVYYFVCEENLVLQVLCRVEESVLGTKAKNLYEADLVEVDQGTDLQRIARLQIEGDEKLLLESKYPGQFYCLFTAESPEGSKTYPAVEQLFKAQQEIDQMSGADFS